MENTQRAPGGAHSDEKYSDMKEWVSAESKDAVVKMEGEDPTAVMTIDRRLYK